MLQNLFFFFVALAAVVFFGVNFFSWYSICGQGHKPNRIVGHINYKEPPTFLANIRQTFKKLTPDSNFCYRVSDEEKKSLMIFWQQINSNQVIKSTIFTVVLLLNLSPFRVEYIISRIAPYSIYLLIEIEDFRFHLGY
jgi:hypothetical protein